MTNLWLIRSILNKTTYEVFKRNLKVSYLKPFGCKYFVLNNGIDDPGKFATRSDERVVLGYSSSSKAYMVFNKRTQCIEKSVHMIFHESCEFEKLKVNDEAEFEELQLLHKGKVTNEQVKADNDHENLNDPDVDVLEDAEVFEEELSQADDQDLDKMGELKPLIKM